MEKGDIVKIKSESPAGGGELAFVYDTYRDFDDKKDIGICLITATGWDTGGWSKQEQGQYIEYVSSAGWEYEFQNVMKLDQDFREGVFDKVFKNLST